MFLRMPEHIYTYVCIYMYVYLHKDKFNTKKKNNIYK